MPTPPNRPTFACVLAAACVFGMLMLGTAKPIRAGDADLSTCGPRTGVRAVPDECDRAADEAVRQVQQLQRDYEQAKLECAKTETVALITTLSENWRTARFDCVSPDDRRYKEQHAADPVKPVPPTDLSGRLQPFVGKNVDTAVSVMGGPQAQHMVDEDYVYEWSTGTRTTFPGTLIVDDVLNTSCAIRLAVDPGTHIVQKFSWTEQNGGCRRYAERLHQ